MNIDLASPVVIFLVIATGVIYLCLSFRKRRRILKNQSELRKLVERIGFDKNREPYEIAHELVATGDMWKHINRDDLNRYKYYSGQGACMASGGLFLLLMYCEKYCFIKDLPDGNLDMARESIERALEEKIITKAIRRGELAELEACERRREEYYQDLEDES
jgi:hypothetical protein